MPQFRRCWVPSCRNNKYIRSRRQFFKFPTDPEKCMKWLKAIGDPTLASCPWEFLTRLRYLCMEHFTPEMITAAGRLAHNAEPVIFADVRPELPEGALRSFTEGLPQERRSALPALHVVDNISPQLPECSGASPPGEEVVEGYIARRINSEFSEIVKVKEEPDEVFEEANPIELVLPAKGFLGPTKILNEEVEEKCKDLHKANTLKSVIKKEEEDEEELEPLVTVFVESTNVIKEEVEEEREDPLATCVESFHVKTEETDECSCSLVAGHLGASSTNELQTQATSDSTERRHECTVCQKSFSRRKDVLRHMRIHTGEKPFECSVCQKEFSQRGTLVQHMRIHSGEKPFECSVCQKEFSQRGARIKHMRIHTGEKPFECSDCVKCFSDKGNLIKHMRIHTREKPFECSVCRKKFSQRGTLIKHMRIHTGEKPFECSDCVKCFSDKQNLIKHMRIHTRKAI